MSLLALKFLKISAPLDIGIVKQMHNRSRIGNRDWVGFGINGSANYKDDAHFPFPAVRFKENTRDICALREKEKGDWRMLCCEEKKALYRASFCQTFAEFQHPTGQWKFIVGAGLFLCSFTFWVFVFLHHYGHYNFGKVHWWEIYRGAAILLSGALFASALVVEDASLIYLFEPLPASLSKTSQKAQLRRMLELRVNAVDGLASHWDYDNDRWKD